MTFLCVITIKNKTLTHTSLITVVDWLLLRQLDWFWNFDLLERNDGVIADKGFNIDDLLHSKGVQLNLQSCTVFTFSISRKWLPLGKFDEFSNLNFSMFHQWDFLVLLVCYLVHQPCQLHGKINCVAICLTSNHSFPGLSEFIQDQIQNNPRNTNCIWKAIWLCIPKRSVSPKVYSKEDKIVADTLNYFFALVGKSTNSKIESLAERTTST